MIKWYYSGVICAGCLQRKLTMQCWHQATCRRMDNVEAKFWYAKCREEIGARFDTMYYSTVPFKDI